MNNTGGRGRGNGGKPCSNPKANTPAQRARRKANRAGKPRNRVGR